MIIKFSVLFFSVCFFLLSCDKSDYGNKNSKNSKSSKSSKSSKGKNDEVSEAKKLCLNFLKNNSYEYKIINDDVNGKGVFSFDMIGLRSSEYSIVELHELNEELSEMGWEVGSYVVTFTDSNRFLYNVSRKDL